MKVNTLYPDHMLHPIRWLGSISIKRLTLLGFALVVIPLAAALLYSVQQVHKLAEQGAVSVYQVSEISQTNRQLSLAKAKLERLASQYVILQEEELLSQYLTQQSVIKEIVQLGLLRQQDDQLRSLGEQFNETISALSYDLENEALDALNLTSLKKHFKQLNIVHQGLASRTELVIQDQAKELESSAIQISATLLNSLVIIPISLAISALFIQLITQPIKSLLASIKTLEQGDFEQSVSFRGAPELKEIADALELMRTRLHSLELQKSSFIRHISHELKTPLAAIREGTALIYDNSVGELNVAQQEIVTIIQESVSRLQKLIEDLLDFNIVLDSTSLQDAQQIILPVLIEQSLEERKLDIQRKSLRLSLSVDKIMLQSNGKQLSVIIDNLLSNAIKYSPQGGTLSLSSLFIDGYAHITIADEGPGIAQEEQQKVFEAFYQGPSPEHEVIKSSGLGLTIVKELVMRLHGTVKLISQPKGYKDQSNRGCVISIILPKAALIEG